MPRAIVLHPADNVATLIDSGRAGDVCVLQGEAAGQVLLAQDIAFGHKVCIAAIAKGAKVLKYGQAIGTTTAAIAPGEHAHIHNVVSGRQSSELASAAVA
jgi:altronate dehydratase small subunit